MISTFSIPASRSLEATNSAALCTSSLCSGTVLMLGIRMNSFSSSSRRSRFSSTNFSVLGMNFHCRLQSMRIGSGCGLARGAHHGDEVQIAMELMVIETKADNETIGNFEAAKIGRHLYDPP